MSASPIPTAPAPADVWSAGDYPGVSDRMIPDLGARLVESACLRAGERVLDVAAGAGNATLPAARRGARVTALDITPDLLEAGRRRAAAEALPIAWVQGDAQAMPFADASFDVVLSCVGVQFCADREAAAAELIRVCRPGGRIALVAWTPEGFIGQILTAVSGGTRPRSLDWGSQEAITGLLGADLVLSRGHVAMPARSGAVWVDYMATAYGPLVMARRSLQARGAWEPMRERLVAIAGAHLAGEGGGLAARAEYLTVIASR